MQWILIGVIVALLAVTLLNASRQKKDNAKIEEMLSKLKPGDKVKTYFGIYGKILSITETTEGKVCVLETGDKNKSQIEINIRAVIGLDEKQIAVYDENNVLISLDGKPVKIAEDETKEEKNEIAQNKISDSKKVDGQTKAKKTAEKTKKPATKSTKTNKK